MTARPTLTKSFVVSQTPKERAVRRNKKQHDRWKQSHTYAARHTGPRTKPLRRNPSKLELHYRQAEVQDSRCDSQTDSHQVLRGIPNTQRGSSEAKQETTRQMDAVAHVRCETHWSENQTVAQKPEQTGTSRQAEVQDSRCDSQTDSHQVLRGIPNPPKSEQ